MRSSILFTAIGSWVLSTVACQPKTKPSCTEPQTAVTIPADVQSPSTGGIISSTMYLHEKGSLENPTTESENRSCSAWLEFADTADDLVVWTSRHCLRIHLTTVTKLYLDTPNGYLPYTLDLQPVAHALRARDVTASLTDINLRRDVVRIYSQQLFGPALTYLRETYPNVARNPCNEQLSDDTTTICSLFTDLASYKAKVRKDGTDRAPLQAAFTAWQARPKAAQLTDTNPGKKWLNLHSRLSVAYEALAQAHVHDALFSCDSTEPDSLCEAWSVIDTLFTEQQIARKKPSANASVLAQAASEYASILGEIPALMAEIEQGRQTGNFPLHIHTNVREVSGDQHYAMIDERSLQQTSNQNRIALILDGTGVKARLQRGGERVKFAAGDSGSIFAFSLEGTTIPFFSLHYLDRYPISDGFALNDLPTPKPRRQANPVRCD